MNETINATKTFVEACQLRLNNYYPSQILEVPKLEIQEAQKFLKIWKYRYGCKESIYAFVCKTTGDIFKPAGTSQPAKGVRGNVFSEQNGLEAIMDNGTCVIYNRW